MGNVKHGTSVTAFVNIGRGLDNAVSQNLRFFIALRNKIEHRELPELDKALLFNFEEMMGKEFGSKYSLNESLAISLQFSRMRQTEKMKSIRQLLKPVAGDITDFIQKFRSSLSDDIFGDMAYSYKVFLLPNVGNHRSRDSIAVEFMPYDPNDPEQMTKYERMMALVKEKHVPVVNPGKFKPSDVAKQVAQALKLQRKFNVTRHTKCWHYYKVRPPKDSNNPARCRVEYCQYDEVHKDYVYTDRWVEFLVAELQDDEKYRAILGK
jgi:hypothetical protein